MLIPQVRSIHNVVFSRLTSLLTYNTDPFQGSHIGVPYYPLHTHTHTNTHTHTHTYTHTSTHPQRLDIFGVGQMAIYFCASGNEAFSPNNILPSSFLPSSPQASCFTTRPQQPPTLARVRPTSGPPPAHPRWPCTSVSPQSVPRAAPCLGSEPSP